MRAIALSLVTMSSAVALADPPPGGTPPPVKCGDRAALASAKLADGYYVGLEPMRVPPPPDPPEPRGKWFHEVVLTISSGKALTSEMPVVFIHGTRHESVSDGGFHYFEGCLHAEGDHYRADMRLMRCDYCSSNEPLTKTLAIKPLRADVTVDGKRYRRVAKPRRW